MYFVIYFEIVNYLFFIGIILVIFFIRKFQMYKQKVIFLFEDKGYIEFEENVEVFNVILQNKFKMNFLVLINFNFIIQDVGQNIFVWLFFCVFYFRYLLIW